MEEVKQYHKNLAVTFYDCKKVYNTVHHDWMLRVYQWVGIPDEVIRLISNLRELWKTRLEIWSKGEKMASRWIKISFGFLQGGSYSPVGFCISKTLVCWILQQSRGYRMGPPGSRDLVEHIAYLVMIWRCIRKAIRYSVMSIKLLYRQATIQESKCLEIVFERGKMVQGDRLEVLKERMKTVDLDEYEI